MKLEKETWYWISNLEDGDLFFPIFLDHEMRFDFAGDKLNVENLKGLVVTKAIMPDEEHKKMQYNECTNCGAKDGRAGVLFGKQGSPANECMNCHDTRQSGDAWIHTNLSRTDEEIQKTLAILDKP